MIERQARVLEQRNELLAMIRSSNVLAVIAGDHHKSSEISDSERASLTHHVVGAITGVVNEYPQSVIQDPRFSILTVYDDRSFQLEDIILD
jgi:hypothetical protein